MRGVWIGAFLWCIIAVWAWLFGPVGFVAGGIAFVGGWAIGHRTGRHDAETEAAERVKRWMLDQERTWTR